MVTSAPTSRRAFAAMRYPQFRWFFATYILAMMADNIEHVISYWVIFEKFHSPALGGFAVLSHWLPFLFFSIQVGGIADRVDPRRLIQIGMLLFIGVSLGWGYFFLTDSLTVWAAMLLLVVHGCAGVFWQTPSQLLLHGLVGQADLQSAIRLNATARYLGVLVGPAVGGVMLNWLGPTKGIFLNACYYIPVILWLWALRSHAPAASRAAVRGFKDVLDTFREVTRQPAVARMSILVAAAAALVGNSYQAQMPDFAASLGNSDPGAAYSALLAADAAGALFGGFLLEAFGGLATTPRSAILLALGWCCALGAFSLTRTYALALLFLFGAGFFELSFSSMAQTVVQVSAPADTRGRVLGVFAMSSLGCRAFAGITVGLVGEVVGVHVSLSLAAALLFMIVLALLVADLRKPAAP